MIPPLSALSSMKDTLLGIWPLPLSLSFRDSNPTDATLNLASRPKFLNRKDYEQLLLYLNTYVDEVLHAKFQEVEQQQYKLLRDSFTSKQTQLIIDLIKDNLKKITSSSSNQLKEDISLSMQLAPEDLKKLTQEVFLQIQKQENAQQKSIRLSNEQINLLSKELLAGILNRSPHTVEAANFNEFLNQILHSEQIQSFLNKQFTERFNAFNTAAAGCDKINKTQQQQLITELSKEVAALKATITLDSMSSGKQTMENLLRAHEKLLERIQENELKVDQRFTNLIQQIARRMESLKMEQFSMLNNQVKLILLEILGYQQQSKDSKASTQLTDVNLSEWLHNIFVAKTYLEQQLSALNNQTSQQIRREVDRSSALLMRDISARLKEELIQALVSQQQQNVTEGGSKGLQLSEKRVHDIVKSVLAVYDADKTGLVDFALESGGGQILSTRCTENYKSKSAQLYIFGIPLWYPSNTPRIAISPSVNPGECWAFQGFPGFLVLKLNSMVYVTGFTLEHIPKSLTPNGRIDSAPRTFTVWGLEHEKDHDPILFGEYEYLDNGASLQYFPLLNDSIERAYEIVELRIESNHGHPMYTCLYRFRVHGKAATSAGVFDIVDAAP